MMASVELVKFDATLAATVAGWPVSAAESVRWCGRDDVTPDMVRGWADDADVLAFALVDAGAPVGYGELWLDTDEDEVELARLIVAPAHRGRGVGRRLVEALTALARAHGGLIFLRVHPDNAAAARVYRAAGFQLLDAATAAEWNEGQPVTYDWLVAAGQSAEAEHPTGN
jgi:ribosomal protein S18 acetylase RimI-like enzyme